MWVLHEETLPEKDEDNNQSQGSVSAIQACDNANHEKLSDPYKLIKKTQNWEFTMEKYINKNSQMEERIAFLRKSNLSVKSPLNSLVFTVFFLYKLKIYNKNSVML